MEGQLLEIASGDNLKMAQMQEIISWEEHEMKATVVAIYRKLTEAGDMRLTPSRLTVEPLEILLWAMGEVESKNPKQALKWKAFC